MTARAKGRKRRSSEQKEKPGRHCAFRAWDPLGSVRPDALRGHDPHERSATQAGGIPGRTTRAHATANDVHDAYLSSRNAAESTFFMALGNPPPAPATARLRLAALQRDNDPLSQRCGVPAGAERISSRFEPS